MGSPEPEEIFLRDDYQCRNCSTSGEGENLRVYQVVPSDEGEQSARSNFVTLCTGCFDRANSGPHKSDGNELPNDWENRRRRVYRRDQYQCQNCGVRGGEQGDTELHAHHIVPKSSGGNHVGSNLVTLCRSCHIKVHESNFQNSTTFPSWFDLDYGRDTAGTRQRSTDSLDSENSHLVGGDSERARDDGLPDSESESVCGETEDSTTPSSKADSTNDEEDKSRNNRGIDTSGWRNEYKEEAVRSSSEPEPIHQSTSANDSQEKPKKPETNDEIDSANTSSDQIKSTVANPADENLTEHGTQTPQRVNAESEQDTGIFTQFLYTLARGLLIIAAGVSIGLVLIIVLEAI
ncbi:HNH endonuclease [Halomicroarcula sp. F13]|uniref:HNH endonuclease n=1 Tax=Haloarcula rubra TaxID=2487747 RepID=A0AAW4PW90_9EURY|nr:HNH endonuclease [Halomicroarcula rubra]MBX0325570.1 HNH endonuclease [Halomicroarcula rubra]